MRVTSVVADLFMWPSQFGWKMVLGTRRESDIGMSRDRDHNHDPGTSKGKTRI